MICFLCKKKKKIDNFIVDKLGKKNGAPANMLTFRWKIETFANTSENDVKLDVIFDYKNCCHFVLFFSINCTSMRQFWGYIP